jgi:hypothetical protein
VASVFTNAGKAATTAAILAAATMKYLGWGTGSGQTATSNDLATAAAESRTTGSMSQVTSSVTNDTVQITGTITAGGARAITEVGVFDALTSGNMDLYGDFSVINLSSGDSISFTIKLTFS